MTRKKTIIISLLVLIIATAGVASGFSYSQHCKQELREVDRYALPEVIRFMETLSDWDLEKIKPFLTKEYIQSLSEEEWRLEFEKLAILGELQSFARPNFVSHQPYKKYKFCQSAIDMYSVASEFDKDNAVVRIFFNNDCGKLSVRSFIVTSRSIVTEPEYVKDNSSTGKNQSELENNIEDMSDEDIDVDLDDMVELNQDNDEMTDIAGKVNSESSSQSQINKNKSQSQGKVYRY